MYCCPDFICCKAAGRVHVISNQVIGRNILRNPLKPEEECQDIEIVIPDAMKDGMVLLEQAVGVDYGIPDSILVGKGYGKGRVVIVKFRP